MGCSSSKQCHFQSIIFKETKNKAEPENLYSADLILEIINQTVAPGVVGLAISVDRTRQISNRTTQHTQEFDALPRINGYYYKVSCTSGSLKVDWLEYDTYQYSVYLNAGQSDSKNHGSNRPIQAYVAYDDAEYTYEYSWY